jgi:hypothetical protein
VKTPTLDSLQKLVRAGAVQGAAMSDMVIVAVNKTIMAHNLFTVKFTRTNMPLALILRATLSGARYGCQTNTSVL